MPTLTYAELEDLMHSENPDEIWQPDGGNNLHLEGYTHIAGDPKTLGALLKYTAKWNGPSDLDLSSLEEISPAVLMILLRHASPPEIRLDALKMIDLPSAVILVRAVQGRVSPCINFGFGFDLSHLAPEVIAELYKSPGYGWTEDGQFFLCNRRDERFEEIEFI